MKNEKCRGVTHAPGAWHSPLPAPRSPLRRRGVTLVELLITILIISILAGLILGVAALAGETAREAQSRHVVLRLHTLLMEHYGTYKTRRVQLRPQILAGIINDSSLNTAAKKGQARAEARLYALRELMLMEIPDRWSDVLLTDVPSTNAGNVVPKYPVYLDVANSNNGRTPLTNIYLRRYFQIAQNATTAEQVAALLENQGAECLYLIITLATGDGEARSLFGENSIGDTDGDGAPEFLDGWGHPIDFLRWAPGFNSQIQINANDLGSPSDSVWLAAAAGDHDPFDVFRIDQSAFRLVPLIYSAGRDETLSIRPVTRKLSWQGINSPTLPFDAASPPKLSPCQTITDEDGVNVYPNVYPGSPFEGATDNIHNHLLGKR